MKKILLLLGVLLILVGGGWFVLTTFIIDAKAVSTQLAQAIESATGRKVLLSETTKVQVFPVPQITYEGMRVANAEGASTADFLAVSRVTVHLGMGSLLSGSVSPSSITLEGATLNLEVLPGGKQNWQFAGNGDAFRQYFLHTPVTLNKASLRYVNAASGANGELSAINGALRYEEDGKIIAFNGDMGLHGQAVQVAARMSSVDLASASNTPDVPFQFTLQHGGVNLNLQGQLTGATRDPEFVGQMKLDAPSLWSALGLLSGNAPTQEAGEKLTMQGNMRLGIQRLMGEKITIEASNNSTMPAIKGVLNFDYRFGRKPSLDFHPQFEVIDLDYLIKGYGAGLLFAALPKAEADLSETPANAAPKKTVLFTEVLRKAGGDVDISIGSLIFNNRSLNNIRIRSPLTYPQLQASLPGDSRLAFNGRARESETGLAFDGKLEIQGRQLEEFLSLFNAKGSETIAGELGRFGMRTNISVSPEQVRLSEFNAIIAETRMAGSLIFQLGDRTRLESYLRIAGLNLDAIAKAAKQLLPQDDGVKKDGAAGTADELFDVRYINNSYNWLNSVPLDVDAEFYLQDFVLFDRKGELAKFKLDVTPGVATLHEVAAKYNGAEITGSYGLRTAPGNNPQFVADGAISELNMVDIFPTLARAHNDKEWQDFLDQNLELMLLQTNRADLKLRFGKLNVRHYQFEKIDTALTLDNTLLSIDKFQGKLWDGLINARANVQAGTIPSLSAAFALENASLMRLSESSPLLKHSAGRAAIAGQLSTSGVTLRSWFNNMQGEIRTKGRDISVQGFGISNLARAVPVARTVSDVERAANFALTDGITRMSTLDGMINVSNGKAMIPQMHFVSPEAQGTVDGEVSLTEQSVNLTMNFYLANTVEAGEETPMLNLHIEGDIDDIQKSLETRSLKDYVAQKAARRALGKTQ